MVLVQIKNDMALLIVKNLSPEYQTCDRRFEVRQKYMFSRPLAFSTIPKACGFEAATRPFYINSIGWQPHPDCRLSPMGMVFPWLNTYLQDADSSNAPLSRPANFW